MKIGLVAHDDCKVKLLDWVKWNEAGLAKHELVATGTTGSLIEEETGLTIEKLLSGPKGGDFQIGAMIATQELDALIFFWDALTAQPHDPDVKALLRLTTLWNIPTACNVATADLLISSPLFNNEDYERIKPDFAPRGIEMDEDGNVIIDENVSNVVMGVSEKELDKITEERFEEDPEFVEHEEVILDVDGNPVNAIFSDEYILDNFQQSDNIDENTKIAIENLKNEQTWSLDEFKKD